MVVDRIKVESQAKEVIDKFAKILEKVEKEHSSQTENFVDREDFEREEGNENCKSAADAENGFKQRILQNSPSHDSDFIIAEKGNWK